MPDSKSLSIRCLMLFCGLLPLTTLAGNVTETPEFWLKNGQKALETAQKLRPNNQKAKNVILFIGDGMGISTITAARILEGQNKPNHRGGEENSLSFEQLPYLALSKTYSANQQTPDSAPTMSAIITGVKTNDGMLSIDSRVHRKETDGLVLKTHQIKTLIEQAEDHGLSTGIVTTTRITHATPAACYAHISERDWETDAMIPSGSTVPDIALQFVDFDHGDGIDVTLGGGARTFCRKRSPILKSLEKPACEKTEET